ncbi:MAG: FAD-dependent oxidoreductase [Gordonia sp. (in: high G+C Gram-positive bacteria)]
MNTPRTQVPPVGPSARPRPHVVVLGGGYAGVMAANRLRGEDVDVTVVNPRPHFVERIRLHQVAARTGSADHTYTEVLGDGVRLLVDAAVRIDAATTTVHLASGATLTYDQLVYAVGSTGSATDAITGLADHGHVLGEWDAAGRLAEALAADPAASVTVVGGGLSGIEMAAELVEPGPTTRPVRLVSDGVIAPGFSARGRAATRRQLATMGVEVIENTRVTAIAAASVTAVRSGEEIELPSGITIVAAGFGVPALAADSGLRTDPMGRLLTDETLTSLDDPRIVGAGDAVAPSNTPLRMSCQAAVPLGLHAAATVRAHLSGAAGDPIRISFSGQNASLGRRAATIQLAHRDDTPTRVIITGRAGAAIKESVCRCTVRFLTWEARRPGLVRSRTRPPRSGDELRAMAQVR